MPWFPIYADREDFEFLIDWLNNEDDIAFIVPNGHKSWIANKELNNFSNERLCLWHVPSGALPLLRGDTAQPDGIIENPWGGWTEERTGANPNNPYFGSGHPGIIWLNVRYESNEDKDTIGLSSFGWIGNWYRIIGQAAPAATEKWWQRLRRWVKKSSVRIPREGPIDGPDPEIWAMKSALEKIKSGVKRESSP